MLKTLRLATLAAAVALVLPAAAGPSWPPTPPRKAIEKAPATTIAAAPARDAKERPTNGFERAGGDAGWQLSQHKYDFANGRFAMSDECDHVIRSAQAPTPAEVDNARRQSPGT